MRPVQESTKVIPLVHAPHVHPVAHAERHALRKIDVVGDEQGPAITDVDDEALVAGAVVIIRQQASDEAGHFDPLAFITFRERSVQTDALVLILIGL